MQNKSLFFLILASILWGTSGVGGRYLIDIYKISPITIGAYRIILASMILWLTKIKTKKAIVIKSRKDIVSFFAYGLFVFLYQLSYFTAVKIGPVSIASIITLCLAPLYVLMFQLLFKKERITLRLILSLLLCICGVVLLSHSDNNIKVSKITVLLSCVAAVSFGSNNLISKALTSKYDPTLLATISFTIASAFFIPFLKLSTVNLKVIMILLYLGAFSGYFAFTFFLKGIKGTNPLVASLVTIIEPLTTTILSVIIFQEHFGLLQVLGSLFIGFMLFIVFTDKN